MINDLTESDQMVSMVSSIVVRHNEDIDVLLQRTGKNHEDIDELLYRIEQLENDMAIANSTIANYTSFIRQTHVLIGALLENRSPNVLRSILDEQYDDIMTDAPISDSVSS